MRRPLKNSETRLQLELRNNNNNIFNYLKKPIITQKQRKIPTSKKSSNKKLKILTLTFSYCFKPQNDPKTHTKIK